MVVVAGSGKIELFMWQRQRVDDAGLNFAPEGGGEVVDENKSES